MDAKDLYLANYASARCRGYSARYRSGRQKGELNTKRFINTLDYSKDFIKLQEVYEKTRHRLDFLKNIRGKDYCTSVINVTFKYSVKDYNRFVAEDGGALYVRLGTLPEDVHPVDCVCVENGVLLGILTGMEVKNPVGQDVLGPYFCVKDGKYALSGRAFAERMSRAELREKLYEDGFVCDGLHYCRFKRSAGSSRVGKCLFIDDVLFPRMNRWSLCGLKFKDGQQADLAGLEAYTALTLSSIIGLIAIRPENILVIDDYDSTFSDEVIAVREQDGKLTAARETVTVTNCIWDGQSLIDRSLMGPYAEYGMVLLRNRFFKSACFNCNLQEYFRDHGITDVSQLNGRTQAACLEDVKLITTPSSIKFLKFGSLEKWLEQIGNDPEFGVVKHEKPTHFFNGEMVQVHYQLLNTLQMTQGEVDELIRPSLEYLSMIQKDPAALRLYIGFGLQAGDLRQATTVNEVVYQMLGLTDRFAGTKLYRDFLSDVVAAYKKNLRKGHILVDGNYATLLGNPIEMLRAAVGTFDGASQLGAGNIHTTRFTQNQIILGSRSPHVTMGNVWLTRNRHNAEISRYINLTDNIVCVNSIGENTLFRLSGADFDSDTALLTDNPILIRAAERNYANFPVPTGFVQSRKLVRTCTQAQRADLDIKTSVNKIGEIVNLSQELNTKLWDTLNTGGTLADVQELYCDIARLDVLSNIEIDRAKREFAVDSVAEIRALRKKYEQKDEKGRKIKPNFFGHVARGKGYYDRESNNYSFHSTTMDFLQHSINCYKQRAKPDKCLPFSALLTQKPSQGYVNVSQIRRVLDLTRQMRTQMREIWADAETENETKVLLAQMVRDEYREYIRNMHINPATAYRLLTAMEHPKNRDIARTLFYLLFSLPNSSFLSLLDNEREPTPRLVRSDAGSVVIHGRRYCREF